MSYRELRINFLETCEKLGMTNLQVIRKLEEMRKNARSKNFVKGEKELGKSCYNEIPVGEVIDGVSVEIEDDFEYFVSKSKYRMKAGYPKCADRIENIHFLLAQIADEKLQGFIERSEKKIKAA